VKFSVKSGSANDVISDAISSRCDTAWPAVGGCHGFTADENHRLQLYATCHLDQPTHWPAARRLYMSANASGHPESTR